MHVGFIGLGIMGVRMATNALKAGHKLTVYNRTAARAVELAKSGAVVAKNPREAAAEAEIILIMLTGPEAINDTLNGTEGLLAGNIKGKVVINSSTVSPEYARQLNTIISDQGAHFIDAPVSGSKKPAEEGSLLFLAGGNAGKINECEDLLLSMGRKVVNCGAAGKGSSMKMVVNLLLGIMMAGYSEALNLGQKCGLDTQAMLDTILSGPLGCGLYNLKSEMFKSGKYSPQFPLKHMAKDLRFVLQTADRQGAATPAGHAVFQLYRQGVGRKIGDEDFAAVKKVLEEMSDK